MLKNIFNQSGKPRNTYSKGSLTMIMYKTKDNTIVAACNELCILIEGTDEKVLHKKITELAQEYVMHVCKEKLSESLLNQSLPDEILLEFAEVVAKSHLEDLQRWKIYIDSILEEYKNVSNNSRKLACA